MTAEAIAESLASFYNNCIKKGDRKMTGLHKLRIPTFIRR
jgi:hypothetical protein